MAAAPADPAGPARSAAPRLVVVEDADALAEEASLIVLTGIQDALRRRGSAQVVLAGGSTPRKTHALLARAIVEQKLPVNALHWWFGDERWVAREDPQSNEGMARQTLLGPIGAPEASIHSWGAGIGEPRECARRYAEAVRSALASSGPDVVMLGIGPDGHTASLFPGSTLYLPDGSVLPVGPSVPGGHAAAAVRGCNAPGWRLTLSPGVLSAAADVVFLVSGADKAGPVRRAANGDPATPAAWIRGRSTTFVVTRDAAGNADTGYGPDIRHA